MIPTDRIARESLNAQLALVPFVYGALAVGVLFLVPIGLHAQQPFRLAGPLAAFAVALVALRLAHSWLRREPPASALRQARVQVLTGLVWAASLWSVSAFALTAGPIGETLLLLAVGAAVVVAFFAAAHLPSLLLVAPVSAGPPLALLALKGAPSQDVALATVALAWALCLILNRSHRRLFALTVEREALTVQREAALAESERLARAKSALISTLSSQVRNGLTAAEQSLSAAAAARRRRVGGDPLYAALDSLRELSTVVASTLDAEDAEAGRLSLDPEPFDCVALLLSLVEEHRPAAAAKGLELEFGLSGDLKGAAVADPARVRQALSALLANAVRYTLRGRIELSLAREADSLRLSVTDTGPGLSADELAQALRPFERVARTSAGVPGAGLGLPLAARLAELVGDGLHAESAPGLGSRFSLGIPFDPTLSVGPGEPEAAPMRVLTAGGDTLSAALLRDAAEALGCQVVHAARPERALGLARRAEFDAVVLDCPTEGLLQVLRAEPALSGAALITLLAPDSSSEPTDLADAAVRKPVEAAALGQALAEAVRRRRSALPRAA